jgi:thymidylate synthase ThyX
LGKSIYPDGLEFVQPVRLPSTLNWTFEHDVNMAEKRYLQYLADGFAPQEARAVLPNALATSIVVTGNFRNWRLFLLMRTTKETHPDLRRVTIPLLAEFKQRIPLLFDDIEPLARQADNLCKPR